MKKYIKQASVVLGSAFLTAGIAYASGGNAHWGYSGAEGPQN